MTCRPLVMSYLLTPEVVVYAPQPQSSSRPVLSVPVTSFTFAAKMSLAVVDEVTTFQI